MGEVEDRERLRYLQLKAKAEAADDSSSPTEGGLGDMALAAIEGAGEHLLMGNAESIDAKVGELMGQGKYEDLRKKLVEERKARKTRNFGANLVGQGTGLVGSFMLPEPKKYKALGAGLYGAAQDPGQTENMGQEVFERGKNALISMGLGAVLNKFLKPAVRGTGEGIYDSAFKKVEAELKQGNEDSILPLLKKFRVTGSMDEIADKAKLLEEDAARTIKSTITDATNKGGKIDFKEMFNRLSKKVPTRGTEPAEGQAIDAAQSFLNDSLRKYKSDSYSGQLPGYIKKRLERLQALQASKQVDLATGALPDVAIPAAVKRPDNVMNLETFNNVRQSIGERGRKGFTDPKTNTPIPVKSDFFANLYGDARKAINEVVEDKLGSARTKAFDEANESITRLKPAVPILKKFAAQEEKRPGLTLVDLMLLGAGPKGWGALGAKKTGEYLMTPAARTKLGDKMINYQGQGISQIPRYLIPNDEEK